MAGNRSPGGGWNRKDFGVAAILAAGLLAATATAQPRAPLTGANAACSPGPILVNGQPDTLDGPEAAPDDSGFVPLFNGKNLKGWWEGCGSSHSGADKTYGGVWLVDSVNGLLFSNQNPNGAGSVLMTNKAYDNYELVFDLWPSFGNDAGVFNRVTPSGSCYQTGIDYIANSSIGGVYFEGGYAGGASRNYDPYVFGADKATIAIGTNSNANNRLDTITKRFGDPVAYGCAATGCGPAHWTAIWDTGGWNQMRVRFFGSGTSASDKVHNFSDIRKLGSTQWIPVIRDSVQYPTPPNPIGLQIHGGSNYWRNSNGNWYRNIKIRPLDAQGNPLVTALRPGARGTGSGARFSVRGRELVGYLAGPHRVVVRDARGRVLDAFAEEGGGEVRRPLSAGAAGVLLIEVRGAGGVERLRVSAI